MWAQSTKKTTIHIYQVKIEIDKALKDVAEIYMRQNPNVDFVIDSVSDNYTTGLKTKFAGGQAPDIFTVLGGSDLELWRPNLADLSDQTWTKDMIDLARAGITGKDGKVYGMPVSIEGYGYMYNKALLEKAGVKKTPKTLSELKTAVAKLKASGIQPMTGTYMDWYQAGMFLVNMGIARQPDPEAFIAGLNDGKVSFVGNKVFKEVAEFIQYDFSNCASPLNTGFNQQTSAFIGEKVAITLGGNWLQPSIDSTNPKMRPGLMPMPIDEDAKANDRLYAGITGYWSINKDSPAKDEAKKFLSWLATTKEGRACFTDKLLFIPAFKSFSANPKVIGALNTDLSDYLKQGKVYGIYNSRYPAGGAEVFGQAVQKLVAGKVDVDGFLQELQDRWTQLKN
jgi:raffinose/stachyose/melibiose transport system substrate-binding protein